MATQSIFEQSANVDLQAINKYMMETKIKSKAADALKTDWIRWWGGLGWYDIHIDGDTYDIARNKRNAFNIANAVTAKEKAFVIEQKKTGMTSEEMRGEVRRTTTDGDYLASEEKEPFFPTRIKVAGALTLMVIGVLWGAKKVYIDPIISVGKRLG